MANFNFSHTSATTVQVQRPAINNKWAQAITSGEFDDDDAQQVKGIDTMDDGNMARRRRQQATQTAFQYVQNNYSARSLPRDQNGQVPPRSRFLGTKRNGIFLGGQVRNDSDEPIDISATVTAAMRRQASHHGPGPSANGPARPVSRIATIRNVGAPNRVTPVITTAQNPPQSTRLVLSDGDSIIAEPPVSMQSAALPQRSQKYQAKASLISGREHTDDRIVFVSDKVGVGGINHLISEYCSSMDVSNTALMLQFLTNGKNVFYALDFGSAEGKRSFDESLRKLVDRSKGRGLAPESPAPIKAVTPTTAAVPSPEPKPPAAAAPEIKTESKVTTSAKVTVITEPPRMKIDPRFTAPHKVTISHNTAALVQAPDTDATTAPATQTTPEYEAAKQTAFKPEAHAPVVDVAPSQIAGSHVSPNLTDSQLDEIVACVVDTAIYMRDCTPDEYSVDVMKSVIRGSTAAFMMRQNPNFAKLSARNRAELVEGHWIPAVTDRFFSWLKSSQKANPQEQELQTECLENQDLLKNKVRRVYSRDELVALKSAAIDMTHKLPGSNFLEGPNAGVTRNKQAPDGKCAIPSAPSVASQIQRAASAADWVHYRDQDRPASPEPEDSIRLAPKLIPADPVTVQFEPDAKSAADDDDVDHVADWLFGPNKRSEPANKHTGLNNSIHNLNNTDVLGAVSGQFTGVFTQSPEFQDLVGIFNKADQTRDEISPLTHEFRRLSLE